VKWFRKAADQGDIEGELQLGFHYFSGQGVLQDFAEAKKWLQRAGDQGNPAVQFDIGEAYDNGRFGVPKDDAEAAKWYRKAADEGYPNAQLNLGLLYLDGPGEPQDYVQAYMWLNLSALRLSGSDRELAFSKRTTVMAKITPDQIAEAQRMAREWKPK
jgi:uncharacterized protein